MTSQVKRPAQTSSPKEAELFDKLVDISQKYNKTQYAEALAAIAELRKESDAAKKSGVDTKVFERELKRQEGRHKMDEFDAASLKKMDDEKKEGTDQGSVAKTQPPVPKGQPYVRQSEPDEGGCTIGETGKILFYVGFFGLVLFGAYKFVSKKSE